MKRSQLGRQLTWGVAVGVGAGGELQYALGSGLVDGGAGASGDSASSGRA